MFQVERIEAAADRHGCSSGVAVGETGVVLVDRPTIGVDYDSV